MFEVILGWYYKEELDAGHSWGLKLFCLKNSLGWSGENPSQGLKNSFQGYEDNILAF